jgi:Protein of unknown function (DUF4244)
MALPSRTVIVASEDFMIVLDQLAALRSRKAKAAIEVPAAQPIEAAEVDESNDAGMSTAEYAVGTIAACAFAAVLYKVVTSAAILSLLSGVVTRALNVPF